MWQNSMPEVKHLMIRAKLICAKRHWLREASCRAAALQALDRRMAELQVPNRRAAELRTPNALAHAARRWVIRAATCAALVLGLAGCEALSAAQPELQQQLDATPAAQTLAEVPSYDQAENAFVTVADNEPSFTSEELAEAESAANADAGYEEYSPLDALGRCGEAEACIGPETMPTEERESISEVHPTGWQSVRYDFIDGESLYNRCHLIAFSLAGENANERNLITGTRYMNATGMLPFEEFVARYVDRTGNHVLYRVTPVFEGTNLVAAGVQMEARSVEDDGAGVSFSIYCYDVQPGVEIDYATGNNWEDASSANAEEEVEETTPSDELVEAVAAGAETGAGENGEIPAGDNGTAGDTAGPGATGGEAGSSPATGDKGGADAAEAAQTYVLNTNSRRFHLSDCPGAANMSARNRQTVTATRDELVAQGYRPCGICNP